MKLRLPDIPTVVITTPWNRQRRSRLSRALHDLGFTHVAWAAGARTAPYWVGHAAEMRRVLNSRRCPLLILEDDATLMPENYRAEVTCPDDADVLYLGGVLSAERFDGGGSDAVRRPVRGTGWPLVYREIDATWVRVFNMHSTHAVLFLDDPAREAFAAAIPEPAAQRADVYTARR